MKIKKKMVGLISNNLFRYFHVLINIFLFFSLLKNYLFIELKFPSSITLLNGNILIIYEDGIKIYDSSMERIIKKVSDL